jgi:hypothetical protein
VSEPRPVSPLSRVLRIGLLLGLPLVLLASVASYQAQRAARVWPQVDTPAPQGPPPALPPCPDGDERLEGLLRSLERDVGEDDSALQAALDGLLGCGGLELAAGPLVRRVSSRLGSVAEHRLARAQARALAGDPVGAAEDLASLLRLGAILEHAGGGLELYAEGVRLGMQAVEATELWLDEHHGVPEEALLPLAEELGVLVPLPEGALDALVWECRAREAELQRLAGIPAPAMMLEPAGVPLWVGWVAELLPGAAVYDAPRTLAMHRHRCGLRLESIRGGGSWDGVEWGPALWGPEEAGLGRMLDNPLGRITLEQDERGHRTQAVVEAGRTLRSRRALLAARVAVERGSLAHDGLLPLTLELLAPEFLPSAPVDPVDGQPLNWVRSHGEIFTTREIVGTDGVPRRLMTRVPER